MAQITMHRQHRADVTGRIYLLLFPVPVVLFLTTLATDVAYSASESLMWLHFSQWLLAGGLAVGALAAVALVVEFFASPVVRSIAPGWAHLALFFAALVLEIFNALVHTKDGWTAVVPTGLALSVVGVLAALGAVATLFFLPPGWTDRRVIRP